MRKPEKTYILEQSRKRASLADGDFGGLKGQLISFLPLTNPKMNTLLNFIEKI